MAGNHSRVPGRALVALGFMGAAGAAQAQQTPIEILQQFAGNDAQRALALAVGTLCPAGNRVSARLQSDCNALVGAAFTGDGSVRGALGQIVPDNVNVAIDRGLTGAGIAGFAGVGGGLQGPIAGVSTGEGGVFGWMADLSGARYAASGDFAKWSWFANLDFADFDRDRSPNEDGYEGDRQALTLGIDRRFSDAFSAGIGLGLGSSDIDFTGGSGSQDIDERRLMAWLAWSGEQGGYVDLFGSWQDREVDQVRRLAYSLGSLSADQSFRAGYDGEVRSLALTLGRRWQRAAVGIDPYLNVEFASIDSDGYTEQASDPDGNGAGWAIVAPDIDADITTASLGLRLDRAISSANGVWLPQLDLAWVQVLDQDEPSAAVRFAGDRSDAVGQAIFRFGMPNDEEDDSYARLALGIVGQWSGGRSGFLSVARHFGDGRYDRSELTLGFRWEF